MNYEALDEALEYIEEGLFDSKAKKGKPRKKAIIEAKKYYKFVKDFLNNKDDLGYNDAEVMGTVLAAYYANIPNSKILSVFSSGKNKAIYRTTIKKYFDFTKSGIENDPKLYDAFIKAKFDINEEISPIFSGDAYNYMFFRYKDRKIYYDSIPSSSNNEFKQGTLYALLTQDELNFLADIYFSKEEFEVAMKEE